MESLLLKAVKRDGSLSAKDIRKMKLIPAEYYGHGVGNLSLSLPYQDFRRTYKKAGGNTIIDLEIEGNGQKKVLVQNVDFHPVSDMFTHVEFINVKMDEEIVTEVPIILEGLAPAVKELQGTLVQSLDNIEVKCLPGDLIHEVKLNVESLVDFNHSLHVSDIVLPPKITLLTNPTTTVATVVAPREEEVETTVAPEVDLSKIEVTTEKKVEEGEATEVSDKKKKED